MAEASGFLYWYWGSFDGSTNAPVVYPNSTSLDNLENQLVITVSPSSLPQGAVGKPFPSVSFTATGGQSPYSWSVTPGYELPPGLYLSPQGILSGVPTYADTYSFLIRLTDAGGKVVDWPYSLTVNRF
jgi:hypothetical protein